MDSEHDHPRRKSLAGLVLGFLVLVAIGTPVMLHFGQKRHDLLPFTVASAFPDGAPFVSGEAFATALAAIMEHELAGTTGWRPNDFVLWGPRLWADNNANRQLGIIQAGRESLRVFKDNLTKVSSNSYDANLVVADNAFRNDAERLWLPSAESKFREGIRSLRAYVDGLKTTPLRSNPINVRDVELSRLFQTWGDLLGDAHAKLYRTPESFWQTDDDFYHAQGFAHVMAHLINAVDREYRQSFAERQVIRTLMSEVQAALSEAAVLKPLIVCDGRPDGLLANHRRNLDGFITEARQKMYSIREELKKFE